MQWKQLLSIPVSEYLSFLKLEQIQCHGGEKKKKCKIVTIWYLLIQKMNVYIPRKIQRPLKIITFQCSLYSESFV